MKLISIIAAAVVILFVGLGALSNQKQPLVQTIDLPESGPMIINQTSQFAIINIKGGDISEWVEAIKINKPPGAQTLFRVIDGNPTRIYQSLKSNGSVMVINPNGIIVGPAAEIDLDQTLTQSTLDLSAEGLPKNPFQNVDSLDQTLKKTGNDYSLSIEKRVLSGQRAAIERTVD